MKSGIGVRALSGAIGLASIIYSFPLFAQALPIPPQIRPPTREEIERPVAPPPATAPRLKVEGDIERAACPLADPAYARVKVTITDAVFNNLKGATAEELRPTYAAFLGQEQPVAVICEIRDAAATLLRRKGYLAAVQVPTQRIENGTVRFEVLYAKITAIRVRGDAGRTENLIASYLGRLTEDEIFNRNNAERYLLLARDLPGHDVRLSLRPAGTAPGELIGEVTVLTTPVEIDFNAQNFAAHDTGRWGGQLRAQVYGLTGMGDRTTVALYSTADIDEQQVLQLGHDFRVGSEGLTIGGRFTYAWTNPDIGPIPGGADLKSTTLFAGVEASYPFVRTQALNLRGAAGFDYVDQKVDFIGPLNRDKLRVAWLRFDADATDIVDQRAPRWRLAGSFELRQGLDVFGASESCASDLTACLNGQGPSRFDGDPTSTLVRFNGLLEYAFAPMLSVAVMPRLQYAFDPLFSYEEYSGGNYTIGRGYDPGSIIGDSGAGFQVEARAGRLSPFANGDIALQPFLFVDAAWVWNKNLPGDPQKLTSVGGGVRSSLSNRLRLDMSLAVPTRDTLFGEQKGDVRLLISLTTRLFPWGDR